ncbi:MAG: tRNA guanosine(34) transglycosylase Tgt [Defluviitaleaceae bacterium]|nr:tRNA guanosine(34) transglycosylase Tgt [Defluviitaleaceae bacterium]
MYNLLKTEGEAKRGRLITSRGTIETPVFMNVATAAAIKGGLSSDDLNAIGCQVALCNTYHLHIRPGDETVAKLGGLHRFMSYDRPILTDSGGFQVFSLASMNKITEEGVHFSSHIDGRKIFMGPRESMQIQSNLASDIAMAFDECPPATAERAYIQAAVDRTTRWLHECIDEVDKLNAAKGTMNSQQMLFGIVQGGISHDIRAAHARQLAALDMAGYAIGGLAVGETHAEMYGVLEATVPNLPKNKPTYLMGVGTPENLLEAVARGIDFFDCVLPARNGRHGHVFTSHGKINLFNAKHELDDSPIDANCTCPVCTKHSRAYLRHLHKAKEILAMRLCVIHNLFFYNNLMKEIRQALDNGNFAEYKAHMLENFRQN